MISKSEMEKTHTALRPQVAPGLGCWVSALWQSKMPWILPNAPQRATYLFENHWATANHWNMEKRLFSPKFHGWFPELQWRQGAVVILGPQHVGQSEQLSVDLCLKTPCSCSFPWFSWALVGISSQIPFLVPAHFLGLYTKVAHGLSPETSSLFTHFLGDLAQSPDFSKPCPCFPHCIFRSYYRSYMANGPMISPLPYVIGIWLLVFPQQKYWSLHPPIASPSKSCPWIYLEKENQQAWSHPYSSL